MSTYLATLEGPAALVTAVADRLGDDERAGADAAGAFDIGGGRWRLEAWFTGRPDRDALADRLAGALEQGVPGIREALAGLTVRPFAAEDWTAAGLADLPPIIAGAFRVFGDHNAPPPGERRRRDLVIAASTAFGTGDHASTWLSLARLDRILRARRPRRVLDLGTGTGILGLALARAVPDARVVASDIEPVAVRMAEANRAGNAVSRRFAALLADGLGDARIRAGAPYDLVLANILPDPLARLAPGIVPLMAPGATLVIAGLRIGEEPRLVSAYRARGLIFEGRLVTREWASLQFRRPGAGPGARRRA
ncbi:50S ribosomal protein L11 methyltransferase [Prosthecomicrobium sp. N25]|uniref:50S ribosomal protein L11 methyltransferase n=1 Tax=Prosthecomicrobium sp. N25 TaxID=3129254 RepID=UPI0030783AFF